MSIDQARLADHVTFAVVDGSAVILDAANGVYLGVNEVGTRILELLAESESIERVIDHLGAEYDVPEARLRHDVQELLEQMHTRGMIRVVSRSGSAE